VDGSDAAAAAAATEAKAWHRDPVEPVVEPVDEPAGQHTGGHSVADLMARLNVSNPVAGGGRRRRED
jgi:hypothetical protein